MILNATSEPCNELNPMLQGCNQRSYTIMAISSC